MPEQFEQYNDFFISHSGDHELALELYDALRKIGEERGQEWKIFLDLIDHPFDGSDRGMWEEEMRRQVKLSRRLIFITSDAKRVLLGGGNMAVEINQFHSAWNKRFLCGNENLYLDYFGMFFCSPDFSDENLAQYDTVQHLSIGEGKRVSDAYQRLKTRINASFEDRYQYYSSTVLDFAEGFCKSKTEEDESFSADSIQELLCPPMMTDNAQNFGFHALTELLSENHAAIVAEEGGSGKTTLMKRLYHHYLRMALETEGETPIPLYVEGRDLISDRPFLILRDLAKTHFGDLTAMSRENTGEYVDVLNHVFSHKGSNPQYLLLIDGYNEIPEIARNRFEKELEEHFFKKYHNVRLVISGRTLEESVFLNRCEVVHLSKFSQKSIRYYLNKVGIDSRIRDKTLLKILSLPMYLKLYAENPRRSAVRNSSDLLFAQVLHQERHDSCIENATQRANAAIFLRHVLPFLSYRLVFCSDIEDNYVFTDFELETVCKNAKEVFFSDSYRRYYGEQFRKKVLGQSVFSDPTKTALDFFDGAKEYFVDHCKLLRRAEEDRFEFIHQIYRDFFCGYYFAELCRRAVSASPEDQVKMLEPLSVEIRNLTILRLASGLLTEEGVPSYDMKRRMWVYPSEESSVLLKLLSIARNGRMSAEFVSNVIYMLAAIRGSDFSNLNLSGLDLSKTQMRGFIFSRRDSTGFHPTDFRGSNINYSNLIFQNHYANFLAGCISEHKIATLDKAGVLNFWSKDALDFSPIEQFRGIDTTIRKMIFSEDEQSIFALTPHKILRIRFDGEATVEEIFSSNRILKNFWKKAGDTLCFQYATDPFNPVLLNGEPEGKSVPMVRHNTSSAVDRERNFALYGSTLYHGGLQVMRREGEQWQPYVFGYEKILREYVSCLEDKFRDYGIYQFFPDDVDRNGKDVTVEHRSFFARCVTEFSDRNNNHWKMPGLVLTRALNVLNHRNIVLYPEQSAELEQIAEEFKGKISALYRENPLLFSYAGRTVTNLDYHPDRDVFLVSLVTLSDRNEFLGYSVLELDLKDLSSRFVISGSMKATTVRAEYHGDHIIVISDNTISFYDLNGKTVRFLPMKIKRVNGYVQTSAENHFFVVSNQFIYQMNEDGAMINAIPTEFAMTSPVLSAFSDSDLIGFPQTIRPEYRDPEKTIQLVTLEGATVTGLQKNLTPFERVNVLRELEIEAGFASAMTKNASFDDGNEHMSSLVARFGERQYRQHQSSMTRYRGEQKTGATEIVYKLFVMGCDFTGVTGDMSREENRKLLSDYGAIVDPIAVLPAVPTPSSAVPGKILSRVEIPKIPEGKPTLFSRANPVCIQVLDEFNPIRREDDPSSQRIFADDKLKESLESAAYSGEIILEEADYFILDWIGELSALSAEMLFVLMKNLLEIPPKSYALELPFVEERIETVLCDRFHILNRYEMKSEAGDSLRFFTLSENVGIPLVKAFLGRGAAKLTQVPSKKSKIEELLVRNRYFVRMLDRYGKALKVHAFRAVFNTDEHFRGVSRMDACMELSGQPYFVEVVRRTDPSGKIADKIFRLSVLAENHKHLTQGNISLHLPTVAHLVFLCEDAAHCLEVWEMARYIFPEIQKLFVYDRMAKEGLHFDALSLDGEKACGVSLLGN